MSSNRELATRFQEAAAILEITGARHDLGSKKLDVPALAVDAALELLG